MKFIPSLIIACALSGSAAADSVSVAVAADRGKSIKIISPSACSAQGGQGSAGLFICQFTAITVPPNRPVTWSLTGGGDSVLFTMRSDGFLFFGPADVTPADYSITVTATAQ